MSTLDWTFDEAELADTAERLDLREVNRDVVKSLAQYLEEHDNGAGPSKTGPPFERVGVLATGVGKTYVAAGVVDYLARAAGVRNFLIVVPSSAILQKTTAQFTIGDPSYLLAGSANPTEPLGGRDMVLITADNFASSRPWIENPDLVKVYLFTVQSLISPTDKANRKIRAHGETFGDMSFYERLAALDDLVVIADEYHGFDSPAFSNAIRKGLHAPVLVGLTGTPKPDHLGKVFYQYALAFALSDGLVKAPVVVGRRGGAVDEKSQLYDGLSLLRQKQAAIDTYLAGNPDKRRVNAVMLVTAENQEHARDIAKMLDEQAMHGGMFGGDACLTVTSDDMTDEVADLLAAVDDPASPVRVIVHVAMLKEGWDCKSVYVLCVLRASQSTILTEQILGRGLRLPWGTWVTRDRETGTPDAAPHDMLDTLDVLSHDRYEAVLRQQSVLTTRLWRYQERRESAQPPGRANCETEAKPEVPQPDAGVEPEVPQPAGVEPPAPPSTGGDDISTPVVSLEERSDENEATLKDLEDLMVFEHDPYSPPVPGWLRLPMVRQENRVEKPSLAVVADRNGIIGVANQFEVDGEEILSRVRLAGVPDANDPNVATVRTENAVQVWVATIALDYQDEDFLNALAGAVQNASCVVPAADSRKHAERIARIFLDALGEKGRGNLARMLPEAKKRLVVEVGKQVKAASGTPVWRQYPPEWQPLPIQKPPLSATDKDEGDFVAGCWYRGWRTHAYPYARFDSSPEREVAKIMDLSPEVTAWVRLNVRDMPIVWDDNRNYNADFLAVEIRPDGKPIVWVVEVKADNASGHDDVVRKAAAARQWCSQVTAHNRDGEYGEWRYLLVTESDIRDCRGSWPQLVRFGQD